jgi:hypothetical protein
MTMSSLIIAHHRSSSLIIAHHRSCRDIQLWNRGRMNNLLLNGRDNVLYQRTDDAGGAARRRAGTPPTPPTPHQHRQHRSAANAPPAPPAPPSIAAYFDAQRPTRRWLLLEALWMTITRYEYTRHARRRRPPGIWMTDGHDAMTPWPGAAGRQAPPSAMDMGHMLP